MAYCEIEDLQLGQLATRLPPEVDAQQYIDDASDHIDARLGFSYVTPFITEGVNALPSNQIKLLRGIASKRASGRIILAVTIATEDSNVQAYGLWLLQEADLELKAVQDGAVLLSAPRLDPDGEVIGETEDPTDSDPYANIPTANNIDAFSPNAAFEANIMQGYDTPWRPRDGSVAFPYQRTNRWP